MSATEKTPLESVCRFLLTPLLVGVVIALTSRGTEHDLDAGILSFLIFLGAALVFGSESRRANLLPFMGVADAAAAPLVALSAVMVLKATTSLPGAEVVPLLAGSFGGVAVSVAPRILAGRRHRGRPVRTAISGPAAALERFAQDLQVEGPLSYDGSTSSRSPMPINLSTAAEITVPSPDPVRSVAALAPAEPVLRPAPGLASSRLSTRQRLSGTAIRIFDVIVAASLLVVLVPLIVLAAIAVRAESTGPAFVRCDRVGYRGRPLRMLKFRKMRDGAQGLPLTTYGDDRFTRIGGLLSKLKIDEIPQLLHVLRGDMSLVGPRPEAAVFVRLYPEAYEEILSVPPGITGLSQLEFVDERRSLDPENPVELYVSRILPRKIDLDRMYADRRSLSLNLRILFWTAATPLVRGRVVPRDAGKISLRRYRQDQLPQAVIGAANNGAEPLPQHTGPSR
jgi:lipopolysaccharide/colanic/teichoic acid biosynthesis glycosyltransferase